jgi:hypothetical protein
MREPIISMLDKENSNIIIFEEPNLDNSFTSNSLIFCLENMQFIDKIDPIEEDNVIEGKNTLEINSLGAISNLEVKEKNEAKQNFPLLVEINQNDYSKTNKNSKTSIYENKFEKPKRSSKTTSNIHKNNQININEFSPFSNFQNINSQNQYYQSYVHYGYSLYNTRQSQDLSSLYINNIQQNYQQNNLKLNLTTFLRNPLYNNICYICTKEGSNLLLNLISKNIQQEQSHFELIFIFLSTLNNNNNNLLIFLNDIYGRSIFQKILSSISKHQRIRIWEIIKIRLPQLSFYSSSCNSIIALLSLANDLSEQMSIIHSIKFQFINLLNSKNGIFVLKFILENLFHAKFMVITFIFDNLNIIITNEINIDLINFIITSSLKDCDKFKADFVNCLGNYFNFMIRNKYSCITLINIINYWGLANAKPICEYILKNIVKCFEDNTSISIIDWLINRIINKDENSSNSTLDYSKFSYYLCEEMMKQLNSCNFYKLMKIKHYPKILLKIISLLSFTNKHRLKKLCEKVLPLAMKDSDYKLVNKLNRFISLISSQTV